MKVKGKDANGNIVEVDVPDATPATVEGTADPMQKMAESIAAIKDKVAKGIPKEEIESIVRDQLKLMETERRSAAVPETPTSKNIKSLEEVLHLNTKSDDIVAIQDKADEVYLMSKYLKTDARGLKSFNELQNLVKAISAGGATSGAEWIPTGFSARLWEKVRLETKVAALFEEIPMPTNPFKPPVLLGDMTAYLVPESTSDEVVTTATIPASTPTTGDFTLTAKRLAARVRVSDEATEDSLVPMMDILKNNIAKAVAYALETAIINGDTAGTHQDSDTTNAKDARKAWDGLRKLTPSGSKTDIATFNETTLRTIRKKMGVYGVNPGNLAWIVGLSGYIQLLGLTGVLTLEKYGPQATILTGELGKFDGAPVIVSEAIRQNLNASGVYDGATTTKTIVELVNRLAFVRGLRKGFTLQQGQDIENGQGILVAGVRVAFKNVYASTEAAVGLGYNLTT